MNDGKNPFSLEENTAIFAMRVLDNMRALAQEVAREEQQRVIQMKGEVRDEIEERLTELVGKAALACAQQQGAATESVEVAFSHLDAAATDAAGLGERDAYRFRLLTAMGLVPSVADGKIMLRFPSSMFRLAAPEAARDPGPRVTQMMYVPPALVSAAPSAPRASPPPAIEPAAAAAEEGDAPLPDPPDTNPGNAGANMPSPGE